MILEPAKGWSDTRAPKTSSTELDGRYSRDNKTRAVVFDKGRAMSASPEVRFGLLSGNTLVSFRTTERDKTPAREVVTGRLLGDPAPGRPMPTDDPVIAGRVCTESGPVLLTFREYREHYGEGA